MEYLPGPSDPSMSTLTICTTSSPSKMPLKGPKPTPSTPKKRKTTPPTPSKLPKISTPMPPKQMVPIAVHNMHNYHGFGPKKLSTFHSVDSLKRYAEVEFKRLRVSFQQEIEKIKSSGIPLAQDITFSNIDQYIIDAIADLETEKQTLTHLRKVLILHSKTILQIAEDLQEEIQFVTASGQEDGDGDEEEGGEDAIVLE
ncbi:uncharacterized protein DFL_007562 [Arthrobotrys flagrans]|uniref:Uncharacterized protein n=1 Tax=Arthrobotrys flagrans TaxID=97331 RepID=A0A436ZWV3_ARTFL|nr:hypothetical protein DFL_007562 [Arthrobotrys flagrans]